jgi:hypothetical protein
MMARLKATTFLAPVFSCDGAGGFFHFQMVGTDEMAVAAHGGHLAHLGHGGQAAGELANDLFLVAAQLVDVDHGYAEVHAQVGQVAHLVHHGGHVQQRLGRDAAHVQADAAQRGVAFDDDDFQAQVGRAEGGGVAAGATAQHQHVALQVGTCRQSCSHTHRLLDASTLIAAW